MLQELMFVNSVQDFGPSWSPIKQYPLRSLHLSDCTFHYRSLSGWSSMISPWCICADSFWWFSPSHARNSFQNELFITFPGIKVRLTGLQFPDHPSILEWCLLSSSLWVHPSGDVIKQRLQSMASQWNLLAPSAGCIPSEPMDLWPSDFLKCICAWRRSGQGICSELQPFPLASETYESLKAGFADED